MNNIRVEPMDKSGLRLAVLGPLVMIAVIMGFLAYIGAVESEKLQAQAIELRAAADENAAEIVTLNERIMSLNDRLARLTEAATLTGIASWYGAHESGRKTANGEIFDPEALTCAVPWPLPMDRWYRVTRVDTLRIVDVWANDRIPGRHGRILDLSRGAAERLGMLKAGVVKVKVEPEVKP